MSEPLLFASAGSLVDIHAAVKRFYCGTCTHLIPSARPDEWTVVRASDDKTLEGVRVVLKRRRYRFEATQ